jgi:uncharacterized protein YndB with AHSA1/START domain
MRIRIGFLAASLIGLGATLSSADVTRSTPSGFSIRHEIEVTAPPSKVYDSLVKFVGSWWNPAHTYSGMAKNLSIDAVPGGCFCERLKNGGGVEHMRIVYVAPDEVLRMTGALGPLQSSGVAGSLTWTLVSTRSGSKVVLTYNAGGFVEGGFDKIALAADSMLAEQLFRLKTFVETGSPTPPQR